MITEEMRKSLNQAYGDLVMAEEELNRPHEDVVTISACQLVRTSMKQMMHYYLVSHGKAYDRQMSIDDLLSACIKYNPAFSKIDITNIECKGLEHEKCDGKYCLTIESVRCCLTAANQLKATIWTELKVN